MRKKEKRKAVIHNNQQKSQKDDGKYTEAKLELDTGILNT